MKVIQKNFPNDLILTADTIVYVGRRIINKTDEKSQAIKYLEILSGRRHRVSTAFNLYFKNKIKGFFCQHILRKNVDRKIPKNPKKSQ